MIREADRAATELLDRWCTNDSVVILNHRVTELPLGKARKEYLVFSRRLRPLQQLRWYAVLMLNCMKIGFRVCICNHNCVRLFGGRFLTFGSPFLMIGSRYCN